MVTEKIIVYTPEVVKMITERYNADNNCVVQLAAELGVGKRSVIAKLSSLGIYKKPPYLTKRGTLPVPKAAYIDSLSKLLDIDATILDSLEKVTKQALVLMEERIKLLKESE
jgi:hypothetical protein